MSKAPPKDKKFEQVVKTMLNTPPKPKKGKGKNSKNDTPVVD